MGTSILWRILVVEDDAVIGMMLEDMLRELSCEPIGPAGSVRVALKFIEETPVIDAAVLDCNLGGEKVWPVADCLANCGIPFVFSTGYGAAGLEPRFAGVPVLNKPYSRPALGHVLLTLLRR